MKNFKSLAMHEMDVSKLDKKYKLKTSDEYLQGFLKQL